MIKKNFQTALYLLLIFLVASCQISQKGVVDSRDTDSSDIDISGISDLNSGQKDPTATTIHFNDSIKTYLNIDERRVDFSSVAKGRQNSDYPRVIIDDINGDEEEDIVYDMEQFDFLDGESPQRVNPSLWRESDLNSQDGVYDISPDGSPQTIYQIRGFDLANMTLVRADSGWIVIDPLTTKETAKAAIAAAETVIDANFLDDGSINVRAVIFTHSHLDHFGGLFGLADKDEYSTAEDDGKIKIYAPEGFFEEAVSENVMAGSAMGRRATLMYGNNLPKDSLGTIGSGLGTTTAIGNSGILEASVSISDLELQKETIDGIEIHFFYTPSSEAPAEMMFYFPEYRAFCQSENLNRSFHNLYTLRGAKVRDGLKWSKYIDKAIAEYGMKVDLSFGTHHWPTWGQDTIVDFWEKQRDLYKYTHDQTLRLANKGYTPREIAETLKLPEALDKEFYNRGYYGSLSHNIKAQYQLYFGWFDGVPSNLHPLPPTEAGNEYVVFMGGPEVLLSKALDSYEKGKYRWVAEVVNHLVFADSAYVYNPGNYEDGFKFDTNISELKAKARYLLADAYEQMGYQAESGPWRNFYLSGALELRDGVPDPSFSTMSLDMVKGMPNDLLLDYMAMRFKGSENNNDKKDYSFDLLIQDQDKDEAFQLIVKHGAVIPRKMALATPRSRGDDAVAVRITRDEFLILCFFSGDDNLSNQQQIIYDTSYDKLPLKFRSFLDQLDPTAYWFNIVEP